MPPDRVVSLIASSTEIVCALGLESRLVGRSHECDFPASVKGLPICTAPKFNIEGTSYQIDQRVKALLQEGLSVYRVDAEQLQRLGPDVIITQSQCQVCAASLSDVERAVCDWLGSKPRIVSLEPNSLEDVWSDIARVAEALEAQAAGAALVAALRQRMERIQRVTRTVTERPTIACIEWIEPLMAAGNWMPELVEMAGGVNLFGRSGQHSPWMNWEELVASNPDIILALPCGWDIERSREALRGLERKPEWASLDAVHNGRVYVADGNQYFNRPGPRLAESLEILAELIHPELFQFGHGGSGSERF
ncbi:MAG: cobalamin-binding protein [Acidobacteriota bacterium]